MKQLKFEHDFAKKIVDGNKRTTIRIDDKNIRVNDRLQLVDKTSSNKPQEWNILGEIKILAINQYLLGRLPVEALVGTELHETSTESLMAFLRRFYGDNISDDTVISLLTFDYEPYDRPVPYMARNVSAVSNEQIRQGVVLYADGGSRGNPGPSAAGYVIESETGEQLVSWNKYLGVTTNNQAEYHGLVAALEWCKEHRVRKVTVRLDSLLVVNQMKGIFKVKNRDLWSLYETAKKLSSEFEEISYTHIPRELNKNADSEVNKALDAIVGSDALQ